MNAPLPHGWDHVIQRLHETLYGYRNSSGLVDEVKRNTRRIEQLEAFKRDIDYLRELVRWLALGISGLAGFLMTDTAGRAIAKLGAIWSSASP